MEIIKSRGKMTRMPLPGRSLWIEGYAVEDQSGVYIFAKKPTSPQSDSHRYYLDPEPVEKRSVSTFTGATDQNNTEIYGDDIVKIEMKGIVYIGVVVQRKSGEWIVDCGKKDKSNFYWMLINENLNLKHVTVIGNIHDNPELLKK